MFGGGQERGLRPGTLPVPLLAGLGEAVALAVSERSVRAAAVTQRRERALAAFAPLHPTILGAPDAVEPHILMIAFPGVDSEALMLALRNVAAISNGSACTSANYSPSHVLTAMGLPSPVVSGAVRLSWGPDGDEPPWSEIAAQATGLLRSAA
jgi:cysteine desulfurase